MTKKQAAERMRRRERAGINRARLAGEIRVTETSLYRWETGRANPSPAMDASWLFALNRLIDEGSAA